MALADASHFDRLVDFLKQKRENVTFHDIICLAEVAAQSLQGFFQAMDAKVYRELREIAGYIDSMRTEIGALQVNDLKNSRIPSAGEELGAIVKATEQATNTIMECAEAVMGADDSDPAAYKALVDEKMMIIFEACSFQDITGQRTRKVIQVLHYLEDRINAMIGIWGLDGTMAAEAAEQRAVDEDRALLNGPAKPGHGLDQADVDMVMGPASRRQAAPPLAPSHAPSRRTESPVIDARVIEAEAIPVVEARPAVAVLEAEPVGEAAIEEPEIEMPVAAPAPRSATDPLAPIMALSAEEKIALFT